TDDDRQHTHPANTHLLRTPEIPGLCNPPELGQRIPIMLLHTTPPSHKSLHCLHRKSLHDGLPPHVADGEIILYPCGQVWLKCWRGMNTSLSLVVMTKDIAYEVPAGHHPPGLHLGLHLPRSHNRSKRASPPMFPRTRDVASNASS
ncbi:unnamed protein product, partial [Pleuronectes platessa]